MLILDAVNIKKNFADREVLSFERLQIRSGDKIGVVGRNGSGKTTLLNILAGELVPDEGVAKRFCEIAYIKQITNETIEADAEALSQFNVQDKLHRSFVSGGEKTRLSIAAAISKNSVAIFADEPTANLDYKGKELLKKELLKAETLLIVSHDRELLDSLCNKIIEVENGKITFYEGNYSSYKQQKQKLLEREQFEYENYIAEKKHLEDAILNRKARAKTIKKAPSRMGNSEARLHTRSANEKQEKLYDAAKIMERRLKKLEIKEKPKEQTNIKLDFSLTNPPHNNLVICVNKLSFSYGENYIFNNVSFDVHNGQKHAIIGENGSGKTTLLNEIFKCYKSKIVDNSKDDCLKSISIVPKARIGYFCQNLENLNLERTILENVMSESVQNETTVRTILARLLFIGDNVYKKVGILSGGERIKVSFAKLFVSNANMLLLDEPTNYLDIPSIEALQSILSEYAGTVLFVSHDRSFVDSIAQRILIIKNGQVLEYEGNLTDYQNRNNLTKKGINQTQKLLLEMRITEVLSKLKDSGNDQELEAEYQELVLKLKQL